MGISVRAIRAACFIGAEILLIGGAIDAIFGLEYSAIICILASSPLFGLVGYLGA